MVSNTQAEVFFVFKDDFSYAVLYLSTDIGLTKEMTHRSIFTSTLVAPSH